MNRRWAALILIAGIIACAAKPVLNVQYNVPDSTQKMEGRSDPMRNLECGMRRTK